MTFLNDLSFPQAMTRLAAYLIIVAVHGFAWAFIADRLGDRDPAFVGRKTLNPFVQASIPGLASAILFRVGWTKSIVLDPSKLKWGRGGLLGVLFCSLGVLLALTAAFNPLRVLVTATLRGSTELNALGVVEETQQQAIWFVLFNLLPIPGLAGGLWLQAISPATATHLRKYELAFMLTLLVIEASGVVAAALAPASALLSTLLIIKIS